MTDGDVNKTVLKNGVRVLTKKIPHVRSVSMGIWVNVGSRDEQKTESGLCHFIEHMLFKGTERRTAYQLAKEFDAIGGQLNAFTSSDVTCFHAKVMDAHLETMTDILSDIFLNATFEEHEIENERPVILSEIRMVEDNPEDFIHSLLEENIWGDHPLGQSILGTRETVKSFDRNTIRQFFRDYYYQEDKIIISAAGNIDHSRFMDLIGPLFEAIHSKNKRLKREAPHQQGKISFTRRKLEQVHMCIGTEGPGSIAPERFSFSLINTILGGNMSSRLFQEIREKHGFAYSVYSFTSTLPDSGLIGIYVGTSPKNILKTTQLIFNEINKLKNDKISETELQDAKEYTKGNIMLASESTDNQMVRLAQNEINHGRYIPVEDVMKNIKAVTVNDVNGLMNRIFDSNIKPAAALLGTVKAPQKIEDLIHF